MNLNMAMTRIQRYGNRVTCIFTKGNRVHLTVDYQLIDQIDDDDIIGFYNHMCKPEWLIDDFAYSGVELSID